MILFMKIHYSNLHTFTMIRFCENSFCDFAGFQNVVDVVVVNWN